MFDGRGRLNGLLFADVPSMNSLESILMFCERLGGNLQIKRLPKNRFPANLDTLDIKFPLSLRFHEAAVMGSGQARLNSRPPGP